MVMWKETTYYMQTMTAYNDGGHEGSPEVKPKHYCWLALLGCSRGQKRFDEKMNLKVKISYSDHVFLIFICLICLFLISFFLFKKKKGGKPQHNRPITSAQTVAANDVTSSGWQCSYMGHFSYSVEHVEDVGTRLGRVLFFGFIFSC